MGYGGGGGSGGSYGGGGGTSSSASPPTAGAFRFNTDSSQLEIYDGNQWTGVLATSPEQQTGGTRGIFAGGYNTGSTNNDNIEYVNIESTGDSIDFGTLASAVRSNNGLSSRTRGLSFGGQNPGFVNTIEYITISSTGNAANFGDIGAMSSGGWATGISNGTRGVLGGMYINGASPVVQNNLDYLTIAQLGNSIDFGDLTVARVGGVATVASPTRGIWAGGDTPSDSDVIDYITTSTLGNAADFGNLSLARNHAGGASNAVRGLFAGGYHNPGSSADNNLIDYITIASLGNAIDFGDLITASAGSRGSASPTRAIFTLWDVGVATNSIEYVQIMSTGNAVDFGDQDPGLGIGANFSNGHGGL